MQRAHWMAAWIELLKSATPVLQLVAYIMLTLASLMVGVASALIAYRSNFGWKPLLLVTSHGFRATGGSRLVDATLQYEIWNRQKYPILIRSMEITFSSVSIRTTDVEHPWHARPSSIFNMEYLSLSPDTHERILAITPMKEGASLDGLNETVTIAISYFDPRRNTGK